MTIPLLICIYRLKMLLKENVRGVTEERGCLKILLPFVVVVCKINIGSGLVNLGLARQSAFFDNVFLFVFCLGFYIHFNQKNKFIPFGRL